MTTTQDSAEPDSSEPTVIEVWADIVCPWCFIGKRRLEQALEARADRDRFVVLHRAFQLDPSAVSDGRATADVLSAKYGVSHADAIAMQENVSEVAASVGLKYQLGETISGNTMLAHRLALWAQEQGDAQPFIESIYRGYFEQGKPIFTVDELMPFVDDAGLDVAAAREMLASDAYATRVADDQALAAQFGASGVPFFVIDRRYGISGAQPPEVFSQTLEQAVSD
ncbi:MAG: DsbA family oxidoreductase [Candidatus Nanopelagicales bacterium]|jgi:predicted DsbA family dithiol-disulfide isomerase|nr:DsbA family oxidoreductase [Candidatus Nanopelagicales bacterium]